VCLDIHVARTTHHLICSRTATNCPTIALACIARLQRKDLSALSLRLLFNRRDSMSVPTPKASDAAKSQRRVVTLVSEKNVPLRIVKELLRNTGILQVEGNFDFLDFAADCPSPLPMWTGGCRFRVPPAPSAEEESKPSPHLTLSLDKEVRQCNCYSTILLRLFLCEAVHFLICRFFSANGPLPPLCGLSRFSLARGCRSFCCSAPIR
jgi:hypothetical protein